MTGHVGPCVIVWAERLGFTPAENRDRTTYLRALAARHGVPCEPALGVWQGTEERSNVLTGPRAITLGVEFMNVFQQDAILLVDPDGVATLLYCDGRAERLGEFRASRERPAGDHTHVPSREEYWSL